MTRRAWYLRVYLRSAYWRWFSAAKRKAVRFTCADCGGAGYDVHHRWYWLGFEWLIPWMTVVLCRECHKVRHDNH